MFHIYFLGSSEGLIFDVANANFDVALWNPLRDYLESKDVRFHTGVTVTAVHAGERLSVRGGDCAQFTGDGVANTTFRVMVLNRQHQVVGFLSGSFDDIFCQRFDAVGIDHGNSNTFVFQLIGGLQGFGQGNTRRHDGDFVAISLAKHFGAADGKLFVIVIEHGGLGA